jgi:hypothetical protein
MDGKQFDHAVRALRASQPRRDMVGLLLGGALGLAGLVESQAKGGGGKGGGKGKGKGGKGKKKGKDKDTCLKVAGRCFGSTCGMGDTCCAQIDCDCRQNLHCFFNDPKSDKGTCGCLPGETMSNGRCGIKPDCIPAGQPRDFYDNACCSGSSHREDPDSHVEICDPGHLGCLSDADCSGTSCRGWQCYAPEVSCSIYY